MTGIVLAAGTSSRLGRPKQRVLYEGEPLLTRAARLLGDAGCDRVVAVLPTGEFRDLLGDDVTIVENPDRAEGIASSIRLAVRAAGGDRVLITLCDQPLITAAHLRMLIAAEAPIAATGYDGIAGVPAIFAPAMHAELLALGGDEGARRIIYTHIEETLVIPFQAAAIDVDVTE